MSFMYPYDVRMFVTEALLGLTPFVKKGQHVDFELYSRRDRVSKISFTCPQIYTEEEARQYEIECEKMKN